MLPIPPDFPVIWEHPDDPRLLWTFDPTLPAAMPQLAYEFTRDCLYGFNAAAEAYALPMRMRTRRLNTYLYQAMTPITATPDALEALEKQAEERLGDAMGRLGELWTSEWLPAIQAHLWHWRSIDVDTLTPSALFDHLDDMLAQSREMWSIHFRLVFPVLLAISLFEEFYQDVFPDADRFGAFRLLQGFDHMTLETDRALWQLSRRALATSASAIIARCGSPAPRGSTATLWSWFLVSARVATVAPMRSLAQAVSTMQAPIYH